jgi:DNA-binding winged helix-turn-helix (wHTH) protein/Flp pilus assembly protein TadD
MSSIWPTIAVPETFAQRQDSCYIASQPVAFSGRLADGRHSAADGYQKSLESHQEFLRIYQGRSMIKESKHFYEFGPFRVDPDKRVLLHDNQPVSLQPKAFETLLVLIKNSETVVLKDDLMKSVWPGTFVEESNLAQNIFVLRKTLGEATGEHRYIVTVPGRGYRFTEKVRFVPPLEQQDDLVLQSHSITRVVIDEQTSSRNWWPWLVGSAVVVAVLIWGGAWYRKSHPAPKLAEKDTIVLADFVNTTGDPVFDGALREGFSAQIGQSPFLNLLSGQRTAQTLSLMGQPKNTQLTHDVAREVCQRTASTAVLDGTIAQLGTRYLLTLKALDCSTGETLASTEAEANDKGRVLDALGTIAAATRTKLGESLASVQKYDVSPESVTTPSLDALHAYSLSMKERTGNFQNCIPLFKHALELDPKFAMAYAQLGVVYVNIGETALGAENIRKAYELRDQVSEREKFYIASHYDDMVTGDLEAARRDVELWAQLYPRDSTPWANLNVIYAYIGNYDKVFTYTKRAIDLTGLTGPSPNMAWAYIFLNRLDEARAVALSAQTQHVDDPLFHFNLYVIDFLQRDFAAMEREAAILIANSTWADGGLNDEADSSAYVGQFAKGREFTRRAVEAALKSDKRQSAGFYEADAALRDALVGNLQIAKQEAKAALARSNSKEVESAAAIALSLSGDSASAARLSNDLSQRFPQDTVVQFNHLPTIRAAAEIHNGGAKVDAARAIKLLEPTAPYELGTTALDSGISLFPVYVRGEAYLAAKQGAPAAVEFQKILDHGGVVTNEQIGALALLGLGRAYVISGDKSKAHAAYQDFLALWKDADPDVPILKQAKAEYAKLQ